MLLDPPNGKTGKVGPKLGQFSSEGGGVPLSQPEKPPKMVHFHEEKYAQNSLKCKINIEKKNHFKGPTFPIFFFEGSPKCTSQNKMCHNTFFGGCVVAHGNIKSSARVNNHHGDSVYQLIFVILCDPGPSN